MNQGQPRMLEEQIKLCVKKDRKAQKFIYETFFGKMFAICMRYVNKDEDDAMDILNMSFLKVFNNIENFQFKGSFEGWMKKITVNTALDYLRANKAYRQMVYFDPDTEFNDAAVENDALSDIHTQDIYKMIQQLPSVSRAVFNMFAIDGYTHKEISLELNISIGSSKWHVSSARQLLKEMLKKSQYKLTSVSI
jgi:RNA polymerase sigma factor (sigma-70 family)